GCGGIAAIAAAAADGLGEDRGGIGAAGREYAAIADGNGSRIAARAARTADGDKADAEAAIAAAAAHALRLQRQRTDAARRDVSRIRDADIAARTGAAAGATHARYARADAAIAAAAADGLGEDGAGAIALSQQCSGVGDAD